MRNKGFTLVEVIATITILAIIIIIIVPSVSSILSSSKNTISEMHKKNLEEGARNFGVTIFMCQTVEDDIINVIKTKFSSVFGNSPNCKDARDKLRSDGVDVTIDFLKGLDSGYTEVYFNDKENKCRFTSANGKIHIQAKTNDTIDVTMTDVHCD